MLGKSDSIVCVVSSGKSDSAVGVEELWSTVGSIGSGSEGSAPGAGAVAVELEGANLPGHGGTVAFRTDLERSGAEDGGSAGGGSGGEAAPRLGSLDDPGLPARGLSREDLDLALSEEG